MSSSIIKKGGTQIVDGLTEKGVAQILSSSLLKDLAEFWEMRQESLYRNKLSEEYQMKNKIAEAKYQMLASNISEEFRNNLYVFNSAKTDMELISNSVFCAYQ